MQLSKVENKSYKTNLNNPNYRNVALTNQKIALMNVASQNKAVNFLGNDDYGISKSYTSIQLDDTKQKATAIWNEIEKAKSIAILTHRHPDGDAIGSGLALLNTLREQFPGKRIKFITTGSVPTYLKEIPGMDLITTVKYGSPQLKYDLAIAVDCDEDLMDGLPLYKTADKRINIDHHDSSNYLKNNNDNTIFLIDKNAPSATEIIFNKLFKPLNIKISAPVAEDILTGLLTDTGMFKNAKSPQKAHETSYQLLKIINKNINGNKKYSINTIQAKFKKNSVESEELKKLRAHLMNKEMTKVLEQKMAKK